MLTTGGILALMSLFTANNEAPLPNTWTLESQAFSLGPVSPSLDLRNMLNRHIVRRCCEALDATAQRRTKAFAAGEWESWREAARAAVRDALGPMPFGENGCPLNVRSVSRFERPGYVVENVLFESLPGLDVNGSVYLPIAADFPPPWRAIVVPVGHSNKLGESYQVPAQVFARLGYVAITFDPPGAGGEKNPGNDHFTDGVRCYLTGQSSNRFFVIDALRCIDYLATRPDVDITKGVGMTGVSGGGMTTMFAAVLDDRIAAAGPSCCAVPLALHPILDCYAPCPETLAQGRLAAYDDIDLLAAAAPTPVLLMAGAGDEVFTRAMSERMAVEAGASFKSAGQPERFGFFLDPGGHAYTVAMAVEFTKWMDRWVSGTRDRTLPALKREDFEMLPPEQLACKPRTDVGMFSVNADAARALKAQRSGLPIQKAAALVAHAESPAPTPPAECGKPSLAWFHFIQEVMLKPDADIELPATFFCPAKQGWKGAAVLYFDPRGRWTDLRQHGLLASISGSLDENTNGPAIFTVDVRGWGDTRPADLTYDIAGWGHRDRWTSYVSAALGDHVLAMRIRDGLSALAYLRSRPEIDGARIAVGGCGMGGVVALHVAAIDGTVAGVFSADGLASFESLATSVDYSWSHQDFLPDVLRHYDLPELAAGLTIPTLIVNPLGPTQKPLQEGEVNELYGPAIKRGEGFKYVAEDDTAAIQTFVKSVIDR